MLDRRACLFSALGAVVASSALARDGTAARGREGALDIRTLGVRPGAADDQTPALQRAIDRAAELGQPLFLPAGRYETTGLSLRSGAHLVGVPGGTRLVQRGGGHLLVAEGLDRVSLSGLVLDGQNRPSRDYARGLLTALRCRRLTVDGVEVVNAVNAGIALEGCQGRVERSTFQAIGDVGIFALDSRGLTIADNTLADIGNNGVQVWRRERGEDGTQVTGNRVERVRHVAGGNGQNGNGINIYRAGGVLVANNRMADCAFSAVRNNAGPNSRILGNTGLRSGEVAIFVEFGFESAIVANNIVDGAAAGISVTNFDHGGRLAAVQGNIVRNLSARSTVNPDTTPYGIAAEADCAMLGNVVENSPGVGLQLGWGPYLRNVTATGNMVRGAEIGISVSVAAGAGRAVVADNVVSGARRGALLGTEWHRVVTRDLAGPGEGTHANLTFRGNIAA